MVGVRPTDTTAPDYAISSKAITLAESKVFMPFDIALIKDISCNWLVCLAVYLANTSDNIISKINGIWFPIMAFVTIGFKHCVANIFFHTSKYVFR